MIAKKIWLFSGCAMAIGLILATAGFFSGAKLDASFGMNGAQISNSTPHTINQEKLNAFDSIQLNVDQGDVEFVSSDHYGAVISYFGKEDKYRCDEKDGTLVITDQSENAGSNWLNFNFMLGTSRNTVKIYLPQGAKLKNLTVKIGNGNFTAGNFTSGSTDIRLPFGKLNLSDADCGDASITLQDGKSSLQRIQAASLIFKNDFGNSSFEDITVSPDAKVKIDLQNGSASVKNFTAGFLELNNSFGNNTLAGLKLSQLKSKIGNGNLKIEDSSIEKSEIKNSFGQINISGLISGGADITSGNGKINIDGTLNGKNVIRSEFGSIAIKTSVPQNQYSYDLSSDDDNITVNGKKMKNTSFMSENSKNSLSISSDNGNISLDFAK